MNIRRFVSLIGLVGLSCLVLQSGAQSALAAPPPAAKPPAATPPAATPPAAKPPAAPPPAAKAPATTPNPALTAGEIADRVQIFYDKSKTFRAKFEQRYFVAAYRKTKNSNGTVVFEKPGKMSWRYETNGNRVVSDGKLIKVYDKETKQMYEQNIEKSAYPGALSFLLGGGSLKKEFNLERLDEKALGYEGGYVLKGVPKAATPAYQTILLYVDGATHQVRRVLMIDAQQNRNRFDFVEPTVNQPVDKKEFEFVAPPGTQVVKP